MAFIVKLTDDGSPVFSDGLITLVNESTTEEIQVNPAARHVKCATFESEEPEKNAKLKTLKKQLESFNDLKEKHPDIFSDPETVAKSLKELETLKESGGDVDQQITTLHADYGKKIDDLKKKLESTNQEHEETVTGLKNRMRTQQFLLPWTKSKQLEGYALPRDATMLEAILLAEIDGKRIKFGDNGEIFGWDGSPILDHANDSKPVTDPEKALEVILATHPKRDSIKLSNLPGGGGMGAGAGGGAGADEHEKYFIPVGQDGSQYNLTKQLELKGSNPALYDQMKKKYS